MSKLAEFTRKPKGKPRVAPKEPSNDGPAGSLAVAHSKPEPKAIVVERPPVTEEKELPVVRPDKSTKEEASPAFSLDQLKAVVAEAVESAVSEMKSKIKSLESAVENLQKNYDDHSGKTESALQQLKEDTPSRQEYDGLNEFVVEVVGKLETLLGPDFERVDGMSEHYKESIERLSVQALIDCDNPEELGFGVAKLKENFGEETVSEVLQGLASKPELIRHVLSMIRFNVPYGAIEDEPRYADEKQSIESEAGKMQKLLQSPEFQEVLGGDD
ncbi:hypothetical protein JXA56_02590 [Candidatus Micrarchaeota archaeon]|nr:hypothetical protein [Candidatus Micrarchaeota archaeon]